VDVTALFLAGRQGITAQEAHAVRITGYPLFALVSVVVEITDHQYCLLLCNSSFLSGYVSD
jgi:hypothetical protein